ncbi:MAG TPA: amino acid permease, partial [Pseudonocardia sp.]
MTIHRLYREEQLMSGTVAAEPGSTTLSAGLKNRHVTMISIAGVIGAGLFVGSANAIATAGPGVLLSYAFAGLLVVLVMRMLGEMAAATPDSGSFSTYADRAIGRWAGFSVGWLYWWFWVLVIPVEATAAARILNAWVPDVPQWGWALIITALLTVTNLFSVANYGEFEFWFALLKVIAIVAFIAIGALAVCGLLPASGVSGVSHLVDAGGFLPTGLGAVVA